MSASSDRPGGRAPRPPMPQVQATETRPERHYDGPQPPHPSDGWAPYEASSQPGHGRYANPADVRTGPPTLEFHPSPLQPGQAARGRVGMAAQDALDDASAYGAGPDSDFGTLPPEPVATRPHGVKSKLEAPTRAQRSDKEAAHAPIVPAGSVTGRSLTLVVAIMCFLACLTTGAVHMMNQSATAWLRDIASEVTVQVEVRDKIDMEKQLRDVVAFLGKQPGIVGAKPLSLESSASLLEPWLGSTDALKGLPVPRMIAVEVDRSNPPNFEAVRQGLNATFKQGVALDDHRHWQQQIRTVTRSFALGGLAILALVALATTAIIISATRSALSSNREIVEVLHFVGATDKFIARQFQKHFLWLGIRAGVFGAALAALAFFAMPLAMDLLGGGSASLSELQHLVGTGTLDAVGYSWLAVVVVVVAILCMFTSRVGVYRILNSQA